MSKKRTHFRETTASQRKLLFETWQATGSVTQGCHKAHVSCGTFYYWKPRFFENGYAALEAFASRVPKQTNRKPPELEERVVELKRNHDYWGKHRIADELAKANSWVPHVSPVGIAPLHCRFQGHSRNHRRCSPGAVAG